MEEKNHVYLQFTDFDVGHSMTYINLRGERNKKIALVVDCGISVNSEKPQIPENINEEFPGEINNVVATFITHVHIDHIGNLGYFIRSGYRGPIYASEVTCRQAGTILRDCAKIMALHGEAYFSNDDIDLATSLIKVIKSNIEFEVYEDDEVKITAIGIENAHLSGAYSWQICIKRVDCEDVVLTFSGDVKDENEMFWAKPIPESVRNKKTTLICESTYGSVIRKPEEKMKFENLVSERYSNGGNVIIASISNERPEIILNRLLKMKKNNMLSPDTIFYVRGQLTRKLYNIINNSQSIAFKEDFCDMGDEIHFMEKFELLHPVGQYILIVSPGMLEGGPSMDAFLAEAHNKNSRLIITSYIPKGGEAYKILHTPKGSVYKYVDGRDTVVNMDVVQFTGFSGHSDQIGLLKFISQFEVCSLICNHGDKENIHALAEKANEVFDFPSYEASRDVCFKVGPDGVENIINSKMDIRSTTLSNKKTRHAKSNRSIKIKVKPRRANKRKK